jgi:hypothetical protein
MDCRPGRPGIDDYLAERSEWVAWRGIRRLRTAIPVKPIRIDVRLISM